MNYFEEVVEFPDGVADNPLPLGIYWSYISSTFLNGFINYVNPVDCYVLDRYKEKDENITLKACKKNDFPNWCDITDKKSELINKVINEEIEFCHTDLYCFDDDIIILATIPDTKNRYMFFWFDSDCSDCCIGKFETSDDVEEIKKSIIVMLDKWLEDKSITGYNKLPLSFLKGWKKF